MKSVQNKPLDWIWEGWLAAGKLTLIAGEGGIGKTTISINLASIISNFGNFPDGSECLNGGSVIIFSTEDDLETTLNPRLTAAKANHDNIYYISGISNSEGKEDYFNPVKDFSLIRENLKQIQNVRLIIIDPIVCIVEGDMNKSNEVRKSLAVLVEIAEEYNCAILGITHLAKNVLGGNITDKIIGSQAFTALARMVWIVSKNANTCYFAKCKSNISSLNGVFTYKIENINLDGNIKSTFLNWLDYFDCTYDEILNRNSIDNSEEIENKVDKAETLILSQLSEMKFIDSKQLKIYITETHLISDSTYRRALKKLKEQQKIECYKEKSWGWRLILN